MLVTLFGIVIVVKPLHSRKASLLMFVILLGTTKDEKLMQLRNAPLPMLVTLSGIEIDGSFVHP